MGVGRSVNSYKVWVESLDLMGSCELSYLPVLQKLILGESAGDYRLCR